MEVKKMPEVMIQGERVEVDDEQHLLRKLREMEESDIDEAIGSVHKYRKPDLDNAVIAISGPGRGIGRIVALGLAHHGVRGLALMERDYERLESVEAELKKTGADVLMCHIDLTDEKEVRNAIRETGEKYGKLTHVVSNAAILRSGGLEDFTGRDFMNVMGVNAGGHFNLVRQSVLYMIEQGELTAPPYIGTIVQVTSKSALKGSAENYAYTASKAACHTLNQGIMFAHGGQIKINAAAFGNFLSSPLWTDEENGLFMQYSRNKGLNIIETFVKYAAQTEDGMFSTYYDAVRMVNFLLSMESHCIQGRTMRCDHGYTHW